MKHQLKDICSITKGAIGIMKADGGKYPLVALSDERRNHSEFQFDAKAVIVPLISSTGHGHASMKRVHYQEGKFALGNILCAVVPNDEKQLNAKYLHLYLQQFKETLLVPLMKGAANVSLPMNKLGDVEIEVPSLERQLEIIVLEDEAAEYKNELQERLMLQDGDVTKLRQAILREAMQGKLVKQEKKDGNAKELLEKIKVEKAKSNKKEKPLPEIKEEEIPFDIAENWSWCRLGHISKLITSGSRDWAKYYSTDGAIFLRMGNLSRDNFNLRLHNIQNVKPPKSSEGKRTRLEEGDILVSVTGEVGNLGLIPKDFGEAYINQHTALVRLNSLIETKFIGYSFLSEFLKQQFTAPQRGMKNSFRLSDIDNLLISLPPLPEQNRIVKKIEQLMQLCDELQYSIQQSKIENEKLLQGALRDALK